jgi:hypothetical protein
MTTRVVVPRRAYRAARDESVTPVRAFQDDLVLPPIADRMQSHTAESPCFTPQHSRVTNTTHSVLCFIYTCFIYTCFISVFPFRSVITIASILLRAVLRHGSRVTDTTRSVLSYIITWLISVKLTVLTIAGILLFAVLKNGSWSYRVFKTNILADINTICKSLINTFNRITTFCFENTFNPITTFCFKDTFNRITTFCVETFVVNNVLLDAVFLREKMFVVMSVVMYVVAFVTYVAACWYFNKFAPRYYFIFSCFYMMLITFLLLSPK